MVATDKRQPTVNAFGPIYGATELFTDDQPIIDPLRNEKTTIKAPVRDSDTPSSAQANPVIAPSPYWGSEQVWDSRVNAHTPSMDASGRVYFTAQLRAPRNTPDFCRKDLPLRSAQLYPLEGKSDGFNQNSRQVTVYDPRNRIAFIDTCFGAII